MKDDNINRVLGRIEATLALILEEQKRERQESEGLKRKLEEVDRKQEAAEKERAAMLNQLAEVKKNTDDFNRWKERGVGAVMLISAIAALVGGSLAASWHKILDAFK